MDSETSGRGDWEAIGALAAQVVGQARPGRGGARRPHGCPAHDRDGLRGFGGYVQTGSRSASAAAPCLPCPPSGDQGECNRAGVRETGKKEDPRPTRDRTGAGQGADRSRVAKESGRERHGSGCPFTGAGQFALDDASGLLRPNGVPEAGVIGPALLRTPFKGPSRWPRFALNDLEHRDRRDAHAARNGRERKARAPQAAGLVMIKAAGCAHGSGASLAGGQPLEGSADGGDADAEPPRDQASGHALLGDKAHGDGGVDLAGGIVRTRDASDVTPEGHLGHAEAVSDGPGAFAVTAALPGLADLAPREGPRGPTAGSSRVLRHRLGADAERRADFRPRLAELAAAAHLSAHAVGDRTPGGHQAVTPALRPERGGRDA
jgi:hypothetical protein